MQPSIGFWKAEIAYLYPAVSFYSRRSWNMELSWLESIIFIAPFSKSAWISVSTDRDFSIDIEICLGYLLWRGTSEKVTLLPEIMFSTAWSLDSFSKIFRKYFNLPASEYRHWRSSGNKNLTNGWTWGRFWRTGKVLVGGRDLTSGEVKCLKLKVNHLLLRPLPPRLGKGPPRKDRLLDAILLNVPFDLVFVFELLQISSSNLSPTSP